MAVKCNLNPVDVNLTVTDVSLLAKSKLSK